MKKLHHLHHHAPVARGMNGKLFNLLSISIFFTKIPCVHWKTITFVRSKITNEKYGSFNNIKQHTIMETSAMQPEANQMIVTFDDVSVMQQVKKTLALVRGIKSISIPRKKRMCGLDRALKDVEEGRVYHAESVDDMFKQILGEDYVQR